MQAMADAIVVGLGAMGSAALAQLARSGATVIGFDRFSPPHSFGSSHGDTRLTRVAIAEGADYVPLVIRSNHSGGSWSARAARSSWSSAAV